MSISFLFMKYFLAQDYHKPYFEMKKIRASWTVVAQPFNSNTRETEAVRSLEVQGQPRLQSEFQGSQGYTEKLCLEKQQWQKIRIPKS